MAQRGRPKKNISEIKELITDLKPAISASECAKDGGNSTITFAKPSAMSYVGEKMKIGLSDEAGQWPSVLQNTLTVGKYITEYCESEAITPLELIEQHKSFKKQLNASLTPQNKSKRVETSNPIEDDMNMGFNKYDLARRKAKNGF